MASPEAVGQSILDPNAGRSPWLESCLTPLGILMPKDYLPDQRSSL